MKSKILVIAVLYIFFSSVGWVHAYRYTIVNDGPYTIEVAIDMKFGNWPGEHIYTVAPGKSITTENFKFSTDTKKMIESLPQQNQIIIKGLIGRDNYQKIGKNFCVEKIGVRYPSNYTRNKQWIEVEGYKNFQPNLCKAATFTIQLTQENVSRTRTVPVSSWEEQKGASVKTENYFVDIYKIDVLLKPE